MNEFSDCVLCPHECHVDRTAGKLGVCASDDVMRVSRFALHFWEEPPISGSAGSGTIFFSNCNLKCAYCQNFAISKGGAGRETSVSDLAEMCLDLQRQGALNINFVTPTHFGPLIRKAIDLARKSGLELPIVWNTSGYETANSIEQNAGYVDIYLTDFKYFDDELAKGLSRASDYRYHTTLSIDRMVELVGDATFDSFHGQDRLVKGVVIRHLLLPGHLDDSKQVLKLIHKRYGTHVLVSIMNQYTPVLKGRSDSGDDQAACTLEKYPELGRSVYSEEYEQLLNFADSIGMQDYFWQDGDTSKESFIPQFD